MEQTFTRSWEDGHAAAFRGDPLHCGARDDTEDLNEFDAGYDCGRHDLRQRASVVRHKIKSPEEIAGIIGIPLESWPGNCFAIATALIDHGVVEGRAVYGSYLGEVSPGTLFSDRPRGMINHGWVITKDHVLIDPTRWVFLGETPSIFVDVQFHRDYDEGSLQRSRAFRSAFPIAADGGKMTRLPAELVPHIADLTGQLSTALTARQMCWIANHAPSELGPMAADIYDWIAEIGNTAYIP